MTPTHDDDEIKQALSVLDRSGGVRMTAEHIARQLAAAITAGELRPGHRLPSERVLADHTGAAIATIRRACDQLDSKNLIRRRHGRPTEVRRQPPPCKIQIEHWQKAAELAAAGQTPICPTCAEYDVTADRHTATLESSHTIDGRDLARDLARDPNSASAAEVAEAPTALRVDAATPLLRRIRVERIDDIPAEMTYSFVPQTLLGDGDQDELLRDDRHPGGLIGQLARIGHPATWVDGVLRTREITKTEARRLDASPLVTAFVIVRTFWSGSRPIEHSVRVTLTADADVRLGLPLVLPDTP